MNKVEQVGRDAALEYWKLLALGLKDEMINRGDMIDELNHEIADLRAHIQDMEDSQFEALPAHYNTGRIGAIEFQVDETGNKLYIFNVRRNREMWIVDLSLTHYVLCRRKNISHDDWGKDTDDEADARTDYADPLN